MNKQVVNFVQLTKLYNILNEIRNFLYFDIKNYSNKDDFFQDLNKNNSLHQSTIITNSIENFKPNTKNIDMRNILVFKIFDFCQTIVFDGENVIVIG